MTHQQEPTALTSLAAYEERQRLDRHVERAIRERADISYALNGAVAHLSAGGEIAIWRAVDQAIIEMGWKVTRAD